MEPDKLHDVALEVAEVGWNITLCSVTHRNATDRSNNGETMQEKSDGLRVDWEWSGESLAGDWIAGLRIAILEAFSRKLYEGVFRCLPSPNVATASNSVSRRLLSDGVNDETVAGRQDALSTDHFRRKQDV